MRVYVYYNLHKHCFSIKALTGPNKGRVVAHSNNVTLTDVEFRVSEAGRQRVLREQRKNVHAGVVGTLFSKDIPMEFIDSVPHEATYNPYKYNSFVDKVTLEPIRHAEYAYLDNRRVFYNL